LSWVRTFIKLLLKYKNVVHASGVAEELIALSKSIKRVIALLTDAEACEFVGVAIPERMSLAETERLTATLERLKVPMRRLLVNMVVPFEAAESCAFCQARRQAQGDVLAEFARSFTAALYVAPQQPHEVRGREELRAHFAEWRRARAQTKGAKRQRSGNR
ncbi:MAG TPA: ArsA-related P-loop ATPase, partial [Pyrinomonadaceae bacterium]|nr:ArsA-related P-loop ATPase [Pyrinomonadaceae bacterium]